MVPCFGSFGPTAVQCLFSLADLELRQHDSFLARQGLDPMKDSSARSQFRALCYRQISAHIGHAVAKASVMRLLGLPRRSVSHPVPRSTLARNCPGQAASFCFPSPLSYADSLGSSLSSPLVLAASVPSLFSHSVWPGSPSP